MIQKRESSCSRESEGRLDERCARAQAVESLDDRPEGHDQRSNTHLLLGEQAQNEQDRAEVRELGDDHRTAQPAEAAAQVLLMIVHTRRSYPRGAARISRSKPSRAQQVLGFVQAGWIVAVEPEATLDVEHPGVALARQHVHGPGNTLISGGLARLQRIENDGSA